MSESVSVPSGAAAAASAPSTLYPPSPTASPALPAAASSRQAPQKGRAGWLKTLHLWHWISSALCLLGMLLFSITGFTLNHASQIESAPKVVRVHAALPGPLLAALQAESRAPTPVLSADFRMWLAQALGIQTRDGQDAEWSSEDVYLPLPRPGGDAWVRVDFVSGEAEYELTDRGWIAYFNDLHKGRNSGLAWSWFIDVFSALCLLFSLTGLLILKFHAVSRPMTWPVVGLGVLLPALLMLLFVH